MPERNIPQRKPSGTKKAPAKKRPIDPNLAKSRTYGQENPFSAKNPNPNPHQPRNSSYRDTQNYARDYSRNERAKKRPAGVVKTRSEARRRNSRQSLIVIGFIAVVILILLITGVRAMLSSVTTKKPVSQPETTETSATPLPTTTPEPTSTPKPVAAEEIDISGEEITKYDTMIKVGGRAFEYCKFNADAASAVISGVNNLAANTGAQVYYMMVPTSIDIMLPVALLDEFPNETSDQHKIENYVLGSLDSKVKAIQTYEQLKAHCDEYLYFNTDTHVTCLGSYYAYNQWAFAKGVRPISLADCSQDEWTDFYGTISNTTGIPLDGDTIEVYKPNINLSFQYNDGYGNESGSVYADVTGYYTTNMYETFLGGSHAYGVLTNSEKLDGSACVLVIDSNGTSLAPFVATHYEKTYVVDYRYYTEQGLSALASSVNASDIIISASTNITSSTSIAESLKSICN
ncbi:MAG: DHHW family protein [Clostridia bacterium]|nr:DHHW family protein [Clostridia bacterium]